MIVSILRRTVAGRAGRCFARPLFGHLYQQPRLKGQNFSSAASPSDDPYQNRTFDFGSKDFWDQFYRRKLDNSNHHQQKASAGSRSDNLPSSSNNGVFEWFEDSQTVVDALTALLALKSDSLFASHSNPERPLQILHVGAGTSLVGVQLAAVGHDVVNTDICASAMEHMEKNKADYLKKLLPDEQNIESGLPEPRNIGQCHFVELDISDLVHTFGKNSFDVVVDKGKFVVFLDIAVLFNYLYVDLFSG